MRLRQLRGARCALGSRTPLDLCGAGRARLADVACGRIDLLRAFFGFHRGPYGKAFPAPLSHPAGLSFCGAHDGITLRATKWSPSSLASFASASARFPPAAGAFFLARVLTSCDVNRSQPGTHLGGSKRGATACSARRTSSSSRPPRTHGTRPAVPSLIRIFRRPRSSSSMTPSTASASLTPTSFAIAEAIAPS
jgi:hypothetical protein